MSTPDAPERDFFEHLLGAAQPLETSPGPDESLRRRTTAVVRRRRRLRQFGQIALLAVCYLVGLASRPTWNAADRQSPPPAARLATAVEAPPAEKAPVAKTVVTVRPTPKTAPAKADRFETLRHSGDELLGNPEDLSLAVRRYSAALRVASGRQRAVAWQSDSWILMALKDAQSKEKHREHAIPD